MKRKGLQKTMSRRKYKSLRTYINARKRKEYNHYKKAHVALRRKLQSKGSDMYDPKMYTYQEYFAKKAEAIEDFREEHGLSSKTKITIPNYIRDTVYSQAYYRDFEEVRQARKEMKQNIVRIQREITIGAEEYVKDGKVKEKSFEDIVKQRNKGKDLTPDEMKAGIDKLIKEKEQDIEWIKKASKYTIAEIRSGKQEFLDLLSEVNTTLKDRGFTNSYDRKNWIRKEFFGYAS